MILKAAKGEKNVLKGVDNYTDSQLSVASLEGKANSASKGLRKIPVDLELYKTSKVPFKNEDEPL
jgi:hypothetical protein